jgi:hypothetical protein
MMFPINVECEWYNLFCNLFKKEDVAANSQQLSSNYKTKSIPKSDGDTSIKMELKEKLRNIKTDQGLVRPHYISALHFYRIL